MRVPAVSGTWTGPFGFAGNWGYQEDGDSGLQLLGHRYYDPSTGRFQTRDLIKDGRNWYTYCENNPLTGVDPDGMSRILPFPVEIWEELNKKRPGPIQPKPTTGGSDSGQPENGGKKDDVLKPKQDGFSGTFKIAYKLQETEAWKAYLELKGEMIADLRKGRLKRGVIEVAVTIKFRGR